MKKKILLLTAVAIGLSLRTNMVSAAVPPADANYKLYANCVSSIGESQGSNTNGVRSNPENALGKYDAMQFSNEDKFYSLASHEFTTYTFERPFYNVANQGEEADLLLNEVTWGKWHVEACKVYLKNAYVRNESGQVVPYEGNDDGYGYYTGVAWNKVGQQVNTDKKEAIEKAGYENRKFAHNYYKEDGNQQWTGINFPEEVVYAEGVTLVDITKDVHDIGEGTALYNPNSYRKNDDGYDLDAISVYSADPMISVKDAGGDSATGLGEKILNKGTWFMYNKYDKDDESTHTFDIQVGNPKGGINKIGECTVTDNGDGTYTVNYNMNDTIIIDGYKYKIVVTDEHLGVSDGKFKAVPGQDDNQDFGSAFNEEDGKFNIFAHFSVEYKAYINYVQNQAE